MAHLKIRHREKNCYVGGKYHDDNAFHNVISYVMNPSKTPSGYKGGIAVNLQNAEFEMKKLSQVYAQERGVRLRHMILAFNPGELMRSQKDSLYAADCIAQQVAAYYGQSYQIVYAVHEDAPKLHIHFVMNTTSYRTGLKYRGERSDLYAFIQWINEILAEYGTEVELVRDDGKWKG